MQCINTQLVFLCNSALTWPPWLPNHPTWVVQTTEHIEAESACLAVPNQVYPPSPPPITPALSGGPLCAPERPCNGELKLPILDL